MRIQTKLTLQDTRTFFAHANKRKKPCAVSEDVSFSLPGLEYYPLTCDESRAKISDARPSSVRVIACLFTAKYLMGTYTAL